MDAGRFPAGPTLTAMDRSAGWRRLLEPTGFVPPAEAETAFYAKLQNTAVAAERLNPTSLRQTRGRFTRLVCPR